MRRYYTLYILLLFCIGAQAQEMRSLFISMPDSVMPLLSKTNRMDFVDFLDSKMKAEVKNRFNHSSELKTLTDDYLFIQLTDQSMVEMKLLPLNDTVKVVCMVHTVCGPVCDSEVKFYSTEWEALSVAQFVTIPSAEVFYKATEDTEAFMSVRKKADMDLIQVTLSPEEPVMTFLYNTPEYLSEEDRKEISPYLNKEPVVYQWVDGQFK